jgi:hypothetical protein
MKQAIGYNMILITQQYHWQQMNGFSLKTLIQQFFQKTVSIIYILA